MSLNAFHDINVYIISLYFFLLLFIGVFFSKKTQDFESFSKGDVSLDKFLIVSTIFTSSIGGGTILGITEKTHSGFLIYGISAFLVIFVDLVIARFLVPKISNKFYNSHTIGDIVAPYYDNFGRVTFGLISSITTIGFVAAQLNVSGKVFEYVFGISYFKGVIFSSLIVLIYTTRGGLKSILLSNKLQFIAMIISMPVLAFFSVKKITVTNLENFISGNFVCVKDFVDLINVFLSFCMMNLLPIFLQRVTLSKNFKQIQSAIYMKSFIYALFLIILVLNAIVAFILYPNVESKFALFTLINNLIPLYLQPLIIIGIFAGITSTVDSEINITSITLVKDLLLVAFPKILSKNILFWMRISNIMVGVVAIIVALKFDYVLDLVIFTSGVWSSIILPIFIFLIFGICFSKKNVFLAMACGFLSFGFWEFIGKKFFNFLTLGGSVVGGVVNLCICCICYFIQNRKNTISQIKS